ncbi:hypothetical protein AAHK20_29880 [Trinickia sp. YCB016]|jgi:DNA-binding protein YbaB
MTSGAAMAQMQSLTSEMDQMTQASAQMQVEQSMYASVANIAKSGASNVKDASRGS